MPLYEFSEYKVERGSVEKFIKNGPMGLPFEQQQQPDPEQDAGKKKKKKKRSLTEILDPEVLKYGRVSSFLVEHMVDVDVDISR